MNKTEWIEYFGSKGWPKSYEVNPWGSCQYDNMYKVFKLYFKIKKDLEPLYTPRKLHGEILTILNVELNTKIIPREFHQIKNDFLHVMLEETKYVLDHNDYDYAKTIIDHMINIAKHGESVDYLFNKCREMSWTLWKTIPMIFNLSFNVDMDTSNVPKCSGIGPMANQIMQSNNYIHGYIINFI